MSAALRRRTALMALIRAFRPGAAGMGARLAAVPRMIKATLKREYDGGWRLLLMAAALAYILSPLDALPEMLLAFVGLIDDAFVATWLAGTLLAETERFLEWEKSKGRGPSVIVGETITP